MQTIAKLNINNYNAIHFFPKNSNSSVLFIPKNSTATLLDIHIYTQQINAEAEFVKADESGIYLKVTPKTKKP